MTPSSSARETAPRTSNSSSSAFRLRERRIFSEDSAGRERADEAAKRGAAETNGDDHRQWVHAKRQATHSRHHNRSDDPQDDTGSKTDQHAAGGSGFRQPSSLQ